MRCTKILGVDLHAVTFREAVDTISGFFAPENGDSGGARVIVTPNSEMLMIARKNPEFKALLDDADLVIPDGIGVKLASRLNKVKIRQRLSGIEVFEALMQEQGGNISVYFLGGRPGVGGQPCVAELAGVRLSQKYGIKVAGAHDGFFDDEAERAIIADIRAKKPDLLLVGLGMVRQEQWIARNRDLPVGAMAGIGGSLDVYSGTLKGAPKWMRNCGLEWLARLLRQPTRAWRMRVLPWFVVVVVARKIFRRG